LQAFVGDDLGADAFVFRRGVFGAAADGFLFQGGDAGGDVCGEFGLKGIAPPEFDGALAVRASMLAPTQTFTDPAHHIGTDVAHPAPRLRCAATKTAVHGQP